MRDFLRFGLVFVLSAGAARAEPVRGATSTAALSRAAARICPASTDGCPAFHRSFRSWLDIDCVATDDTTRQIATTRRAREGAERLIEMASHLASTDALLLNAIVGHRMNEIGLHCLQLVRPPDLCARAGRISSSTMASWDVQTELLADAVEPEHRWRRELAVELREAARTWSDCPNP